MSETRVIARLAGCQVGTGKQAQTPVRGLARTLVQDSAAHSDPRPTAKGGAVTIDDDFFASGGDSLLAMEMLIEVERLIGHRLPETTLYGAETIRQLVPKIAMQTGTPATPFFQFGASCDRPPCSFFNGNLVGGHSGMRRMVELLGLDYPIVSIDPHGLHGERIPPSIEQMAADRLPLVLQRQSSGPFLLGGKCNGAMVAFETARLLMAAGHKVDMVAMVDPPTVSARPVPRAIIGLMKPLLPLYPLRWAFEKMAELERYFKAPKSAPITIAELEIPPVLWQAYSIAMSQYLPAPLEVPVAFYAAEHDGRAWRHLSSQLDVVEVPWGHHGCLTIGAEQLVGHLRQRIDALVDGWPSATAYVADVPPQRAKKRPQRLRG
ncbi:hypothetical protein JQ600_04800 [Bradyrhizobium sp. AUGA SZCCT0176]|nr:hypothetical protein [Bradyrhizobium sp. AUGA SZCCT0176]MBR1301807.1 hypothetical protein [Bradyrhizobium sp. AUGA SZCCT0042]